MKLNNRILEIIEQHPGISSAALLSNFIPGQQPSVKATLYALKAQGKVYPVARVKAPPPHNWQSLWSLGGQPADRIPQERAIDYAASDKAFRKQIESYLLRTGTPRNCY